MNPNNPEMPGLRQCTPRSCAPCVKPLLGCFTSVGHTNGWAGPLSATNRNSFAKLCAVWLVGKREGGRLWQWRRLRGKLSRMYTLITLPMIISGLSYARLVGLTAPRAITHLVSLAPALSPRHPAESRWSRDVACAAESSSAPAEQEAAPAQQAPRRRKRRLDEVCLERHPEYSRNVIQSWIAQGTLKRHRRHQV